ncbi:hypothetical protein ACWDRB_47515 [Nonomuraea sp. NPDC003707]
MVETVTEPSERSSPRRQRTGGSRSGEAKADESFNALDRAKAEMERLNATGGGGVGAGVLDTSPDSVLVGTVLGVPQPAFQVPTGPQYEDAPDAADPRDKLLHYERIIRGAQEAHDGAVDRAERYLTLTQGLALEKVKKGDLWELLGYKSFQEYVEDRLHMSRQHAYKMMQAAPVHRDLPHVAKLTFRQIAILARLPDAATRQRVWGLVEKWDDTSPAALQKAVDELHMVLGPENPAPAPDRPRKELLPRYTKSVTLWRDDAALEQLARDNPEQAEEMATVLENAAKRLRARTNGLKE